MRHLLLALAVIGCSSDRATAPRTLSSAVRANGAAAAVEHSVTGTAEVHPAPGFAFKLTYAVHQDANGRVWGTIVNKILDLSLYGTSATGEFASEPVCMRVVGNTAYIAARTIRSAVPEISGPGDLGVFWVRDNGTSGDVTHGGPAAFFDPANQICSEKPPLLPPDVVTSGNLTVR